MQLEIASPSIHNLSPSGLAREIIKARTERGSRGSGQNDAQGWCSFWDSTWIAASAGAELRDAIGKQTHNARIASPSGENTLSTHFATASKKATGSIDINCFFSSCADCASPYWIARRTAAAIATDPPTHWRAAWVTIPWWTEALRKVVSSALKNSQPIGPWETHNSNKAKKKPKPALIKGKRSCDHISENQTRSVTIPLTFLAKACGVSSSLCFSALSSFFLSFFFLLLCHYVSSFSLSGVFEPFSHTCSHRAAIAQSLQLPYLEPR